MNLIFTGVPTKQEIMIFLQNKPYSLLKKRELRKDIIRSASSYCNFTDNYCSNKSRNTSHTDRNATEVGGIHCLTEMYFAELGRSLFYLSFYKRPTYTFMSLYTPCMYELQDVHAHNKQICKRTSVDVRGCDTQNTKRQKLEVNQTFFDEVSDENNQVDDLATAFHDRNDTFRPPVRCENLKSISKIAEKNRSKQNVINLNEMKIANATLPNKIDFDYQKVERTKLALTEISVNAANTHRKTHEDTYKRLIQRNTQINSIYRNIKVLTTNTRLASKPRSKKRKTSLIKWADEPEIDIHNPSSPTPILKQSQNVINKFRQKKKKEIVFIQNIDNVT